MARLKLSCVLTDHAVLQHSRQAPIWGWAEPGNQVTVRFREQTVGATAGADGKFVARVETGAAGGPFEMVISVGEETVTVGDVLVGEVWLCSGQSNMEWPLRETVGAEEEVAQAKYGTLRLLTIPQTPADTPQNEVPGKWVCCSPEAAAAFSAVGFHFGKHLQQNLNVPVGLICSAWGGTTAEAWTSRKTLEAEEELAYLADVSEVQGPHVDPGIAPEAVGWASAELGDSGWGEMLIPQAWERTGLNIDGAVWFRKAIEIPAGMAGKALVLSLDIVDDFDQTFFNGARVGATGPETAAAWGVSRRYVVPGELVKAGRNVIAVRVFDQWGDGGIMGKAERMFVAVEGDEEGESQRIAIDGRWRYQVELALPPRSPASAVKAMSLYNGMLHPLAPFAIAGAIWYQGESNVDRAYEYRRLFPTMIRCWREAWGEEFWFLFVLLAGWHAHPVEPGESRIAELRDAQLATLAVRRTAAASAIDLGDIEDIHPRRKKEVGVRLAMAALAGCYGQAVEGSGPVLGGVEKMGREARLWFSHAEGLHAEGEGEVRGFMVAEAQGEFHWAKARVEGDTVVLRCEEVARIEQVRYNWADYPQGDLYNAAGLPMLPFRTDDRAYVTAPMAEQYGRLG